MFFVRPKGLFVILALFSSPLWASKARMKALNDSFQLVDPSNTYNNLLDIGELSDYVLIETGLTSPTTDQDNAEALWQHTLDENNKIQAGYGHQNSIVYSNRNFINTLSSSSFKLQQNPLHLAYWFQTADYTHAFSIDYSHSSDRVALAQEKSLNLRYAVEMGKWQFNSEYVVTDTAESSATKKFDASRAYKLSLLYDADTTSMMFSFSQSQLHLYDSSVERDLHARQNFTLAVADSRTRDENTFFWGAQILVNKTDCLLTTTALTCDQTATSTKLPLWLAVEAQASDMIVLRGSVVQSFVLNQSKDNVGYPAGLLDNSNGAISKYDFGPNTASVNIGAGFKFSRLTIDGMLSSGTQSINLSSFLTQASLTLAL